MGYTLMYTKGMKRTLLLLGCVVLSLAAGVIGSLATGPNIESWYAFLAKPPFLPPNWVFAPVWTVLYILMGISLYLIISAKPKNATKLYWLFGAQLVVNAVWSFVFFEFHLLWAGVVVILALLGLVLFVIREFLRVSKVAAYLLVPYVLWLCFATYLNVGVASLN